MARTYLDAIRCVRDIKRVRVFSPTKKNREAFADEMTARFSIPVEPVESAYQAVKGCDILACCTDSVVPTFDAAWIEPGMHIANLNWHELSYDAFARIDRMSRKGNLSEGRRSYREGQNAYFAGTPEERRRLPSDALDSRPYEGFRGEAVEFEEILRGNEKGRTSPEQVTFFQNSGNQGIQFSSVGAVVYNAAKQQGLGRELPTEWFLQDIRD
jgi:alanine dehydrogenase